MDRKVGCKFSRGSESGGGKFLKWTEKWMVQDSTYERKVVMVVMVGQTCKTIIKNGHSCLRTLAPPALTPLIYLCKSS